MFSLKLVTHKTSASHGWWGSSSNHMAHNNCYNIMYCNQNTLKFTIITLCCEPSFGIFKKYIQKFYFKQLFDTYTLYRSHSLYLILK